MSNAERQKRFRERRDAKLARMDAGLREIDRKLIGNGKPLAVEIKAIVARSLS